MSQAAPPSGFEARAEPPQAVAAAPGPAARPDVHDDLQRTSALPARDATPRSARLEAQAQSLAQAGEGRLAYEALVQAEAALRAEGRNAAVRRARQLAARDERRHAEARARQLRGQVERQRLWGAGLSADIEVMQRLGDLGRRQCAERDVNGVFDRLLDALPALVPGSGWVLWQCKSAPGGGLLPRAATAPGDEAAARPGALRCAARARTEGDGAMSHHPLRNGVQVAGVLTLCVGKDGPHERSVVEGLCAWAEVALASATLLQALDDAHRRLWAARDQAMRARSVAVHLAQERSRFVSTLSHDLQTPLSALDGWLETLALRGDSMTPAACARARRMALALCDQVHRMVDGFAPLRDAAAGRPVPRWSRVDLAALLHRVAGPLDLVARRKGQHLCVAAPPGPMQAVADEGMVERIVTNLLDNALRHTPAGTRIRLELQQRGGRLAVSVLDDGPGWPGGGDGPAPGARRVGHGMGLHIVQALLQQHSASLRRPAREGWTTAFEFDLPEAPA